MTVKERIKVGIDTNHVANEKTVDYWKKYLNGDDIKIGDQIWYSFTKKNNHEVNLHVINVNNLKDYLVCDDEFSKSSKHCSVPVLKLKKYEKSFYNFV